MARGKASRMEYLGGYSCRKGLLGVLAFPESYPPDTEFTMFYTTLNGEWRQLQFDFDIASLSCLVDASRGVHSWWLAGKRGEMVEVTSGVPRIEKIPTAGTGPKNKYGYLAQIRTIGETMFVCGYRRQVYRRKSGSWELISGDILDNRKKGPWNGFESIDGLSSSDVYAVGDEGEIWHYDGAKWTQCDSPTNSALASIRCIDGVAWACGDGGVIVRGTKSAWEVVCSDQDPSTEWWSIESFQGEMYVAGGAVLGKLVKDKVVPVDTGISNLTAYTLHEKEGTLYSIGPKHILAFDGKKWKEMVCPENR